MRGKWDCILLSVLCALMLMLSACSENEQKTKGNVETGEKATQGASATVPLTITSAIITNQKTEVPHITTAVSTTKPQNTEVTTQKTKTAKPKKSPTPTPTPEPMTEEELAELIKKLYSNNSPEENYSVKYSESKLAENKSELEDIFNKVKAVKKCDSIYLFEDGKVSYLDENIHHVKPENPLSKAYINKTSEYLRKNGFSELFYEDGYMKIMYEREILGPDRIDLSKKKIVSSWRMEYYLLYDPDGKYKTVSLIKELDPGWYMLKQGIVVSGKEYLEHFTEEELETCEMVGREKFW